jgi:hypothetical protein
MNFLKIKKPFQGKKRFGVNQKYMGYQLLFRGSKFNFYRITF